MPTGLGHSRGKGPLKFQAFHRRSLHSDPTVPSHLSLKGELTCFPNRGKHKHVTGLFVKFFRTNHKELMLAFLHILQVCLLVCLVGMMPMMSFVLFVCLFNFTIYYKKADVWPHLVDRLLFLFVSSVTFACF